MSSSRTPPAYGDMFPLQQSERQTQRELEELQFPPVSRGSGYREEYKEETEEEDDISDLTFDRSAFEVYTHTQQPSPLLHAQQEEGRVRYGSRRGYAPTLQEEEEDETSESDSMESPRPPPRRLPPRLTRGRGRRFLSKKEQQRRAFLRRMEEASTFESRFYNSSTLVIFAQVVVMVLMIRQGGVMPLAENPMLGPPVEVMIDFGAQQGGYVINEGQWWRLVTAMFVHAGVVHLACNVYVQWQVCGFLSALWGRFSWLLIYFFSGIFGNIYSVIESPNAVGVGSSGGLMGVLAAWAVFIVITWNLVPEDQKSERNKQLCSLIVNIIIVIAIGQLKFVDGYAHLGGLIQGALLGLFLLSDEQSSISWKWVLRTFSLGSIIVLYIWALVIAWKDVEPSDDIY